MKVQPDKLASTTKNWLGLFVSLVVVLFISAVSFNILRSEDKLLKHNQDLHLVVTKVKEYKGALLLEDSIAISAETPLISPINKIKAFANYKENLPKEFRLKQLVAPYTIVKRRRSDTIIIYHHSDTLLFKLLSD